MSAERKIFWAFLWLALALIGLGCAARQVRLYVFVLPVPMYDPAAPAAPDDTRARRQRLMLIRPQSSVFRFQISRGPGRPGEGSAVTTPAGASRDVSARRVNLP